MAHLRIYKLQKK